MQDCNITENAVKHISCKLRIEMFDRVMYLVSMNTVCYSVTHAVILPYIVTYVTIAIPY